VTAQNQKKLRAKEVAREVVDSYRAHWLFLILAAMVVLLPQALADGFLDHLQVEGVRSARDVALLAAVPLTAVVNLGGQAFYAGLTAAAVIEWREHRPLPNMRALVRAVPIKQLILVDIVISLGSALGFLLLVIPGLVWLAYVSLAPAIIKFEHRGVWESIRRSRELVRGNFWRVMWIVVGTITVTELAVEAVSVPLHDDVLIAGVDLVTDGLLQPIEGLVVVVVALKLLEMRNELPKHAELARAVGDIPENRP
jgi:Uncharacterised protein family (UPF0259)